MRDVSYPTAGEILQHEFLDPMGISPQQLAQSTDLPLNVVEEIINGRRAVTTDVGERLSRYFGMSATFWVGLQLSYEESLLEISLLGEDRHLDPGNAHLRDD